MLPIMEGLGALSREKNCDLCMAPPPFVVARVSVRVRFYHLTAHLKGLVCVPCVCLLSENHHIGS